MVDLKPLLAVETINSLMVDLPPFTPQQDIDSTVTVAGSGLSDPADPLPVISSK